MHFIQLVFSIKYLQLFKFLSAANNGYDTLLLTLMKY